MNKVFLDKNDYPRLEFCKKLTEIGFPKNTFAAMTKSGEVVYGEDSIFSKVGYTWICPSVTDLFKVLPEDTEDGHLHIKKYKGWVSVRYQKNSLYKKSFEGTLADALSEMIIWMNEENKIKF